MVEQQGGHIPALALGVDLLVGHVHSRQEVPTRREAPPQCHQPVKKRTPSSNGRQPYISKRETATSTITTVTGTSNSPIRCISEWKFAPFYPAKWASETTSLRSIWGGCWGIFFWVGSICDYPSTMRYRHWWKCEHHPYSEIKVIPSFENSLPVQVTIPNLAAGYAADANPQRVENHSATLGRRKDRRWKCWKDIHPGCSDVASWGPSKTRLPRGRDPRPSTSMRLSLPGNAARVRRTSRRLPAQWVKWWVEFDELMGNCRRARKEAKWCRWLLDRYPKGAMRQEDN